ncbi:MAG: HAD family phosphatase [Ruminococcus sp.]|jgi:HAD superfamily hydrolase (TIGR01509 family)|nr:HAD family phosphatase [Ruminococcus sp.]
MIEGLIFDMDGTLIDSSQLWIDVDKIFFGEIGVPYTDEISEALKHMSFNEAAVYIRDIANLQMTPEEIGKRLTDLVTVHHRNCPMLPGALEFIGKARDKGLKMCVLTAGISGVTADYFKHKNLDGVFEFIMTADEIGISKHNPEAFVKCAAKLGLKPAQTVVFEDSFKAALSAKEAGCHTIGIATEHNLPRHEILKKICDKVVPDFWQIADSITACEH